MCTTILLKNNELYFLKIINYFLNYFNFFFFFCKISHNQIQLKTWTIFQIFLAFFFKYNTLCQFFLNDLFGFETLKVKKEGRYFLVYGFLSIIYNLRLFCYVPVFFKNYNFSLIFLFNSSNWLEREVWDLFGIYFINHIDLRRILTDYGFKNHPLRKIFPLSGFIELWYSDIKRRVLYTKIILFQEFRNFEFLFSFWKIPSK